MILMIDNYDSFTYNLVQYLMGLGKKIRVYRNDEITPEQVEDMELESIVISPGPGTPADAGVSVPLIFRFSGRLPILGVCLGHQCIGEAFGGRVIRAGRLMHGKTSNIEHYGDRLFSGIRSPFSATRYHSLVLDPAVLPECLQVTARSEDGEIMALRHCSQPTLGIQFHPESILTTSGKRLLANFLRGEKNERNFESVSGG